jgi:TonB family protein
LIRVFASGETVSYEAVDSTGVTRAERLRLDAGNAAKARDSAEVLETQRRAALAGWARRVRATVETYWIPPRRGEFKGLQAHRAVATLRVGADGRVLSVGWGERSASKAFNDKADKALRRVRRLPPLPPEAAGEPIELRYEFVSAKSREKGRPRSFAPADTSGAETSLD